MNLQGSTTFGEYALATGEASVRRLAILDRVHNPGTRQLLEHSGLRAGMRVADVGCGIGAVTRLLSDLVGPEGKVIGVDASNEQLEQARRRADADGWTNTTFVHADAVNTRLPRESFDLVYCRFLLLHLTDPEAALREMHALLRPDGTLVCEDADLTAARSIPASALDALAELFRRLGRVRGVDYAVSRRLFHLVVAAGFPNPDIYIYQPAFSRGEAKSLFELSVMEARSAFIGAGIVTADELESTLAEMHRAANDPNVLALLPPVTQVWARKQPLH